MGRAPRKCFQIGLFNAARVIAWAILKLGCLFLFLYLGVASKVEAVNFRSIFVFIAVCCCVERCFSSVLYSIGVLSGHICRWQIWQNYTVEQSVPHDGYLVATSHRKSDKKTATLSVYMSAKKSYGRKQNFV